MEEPRFEELLPEPSEPQRAEELSYAEYSAFRGIAKAIRHPFQRASQFFEDLGAGMGMHQPPSPK